MEYIIVFFWELLVVGLISWRWSVNIDYMKEKHPDYKGEEFLNWDRKNDDWDKQPK